nr:immunoglobulin heavy chain junction region [Mus musculus]MBK4196254.1 immunoglobulin heavy chain junction region [Mus musculus]
CARRWLQHAMDYW